MKLLKLLATLLGASLFLSACAPLSPLKSEQAGEIKSGLLDIALTPKLVTQANVVQMIYFNPEGSVVLRRADGGEQVLNDENEKDMQRTNAVLHSDGQSLYALWRPKLIKAIDGVGGPGDKLVYFRASLDGGKSFGPVQRLNQKGGAFKPFIASSGKGDVYVAWTDERDSGTDLDIYLNVSNDRGANWRQKDIKINGAESKMAIDLSLVADSDRVHVSWMTRTDDQQFKIFVRSSEDRGATWQAPVAANISLSQPASPRLVKTSSGLLLCWGSAETVRCTRSTDFGKSWSDSVVVQDSEGAAGLVLEADPKGNAHMLIAKKPADEKAKLNFYHVMSEGGSVFSKPQRVTGGEPHKNTTILPVLSFGDDGSMLAAWVDMRYWRPVIAINYSADMGKTWLPDSVVLAGKKGVFHFFPTVSYAGSGKYSLAWLETVSRSIPGSVIGQADYRPGFRGVTMPPPDAKSLKERADKFWRLREADKWGEIYDLLDPYFREINSRSAYIKSQGSVKYFSHRLVNEPEIKGSLATVKVAYESEVPEVMLKGKKISIPKQEVEIDQEWVWVDGDWYQVFRDLFGGSALID